MARTYAGSRKDDSMNALLSLLHKENKSQIEMHIAYCADRRKYDFSYLNSEQAAAELAAKDGTIKHDKNMLATDGKVFLQCMRLLGMDESGASTTDIPDAIERQKERIKELETAMLSIEFDETTGECLLGCGGDSVGGHTDDCVWWKNDTFRGVSNNRLDNS